ncbi:MAG TPA: hypothetical protein VKA27_06675 [Sunxiuqinia sp.]|nr:hypothetical protein [Sunxiuqinia sp.]
MKKAFYLAAIIILCAFKPIPKGVAPADTAEWKIYVDYCNKFVPVYLYQWCKFRIKQNNIGQWVNDRGEYIRDTTYKVKWYPVTIPEYAEPNFKSSSQDCPECDINEHAIAFRRKYLIQRREATIVDFYAHLNDSIPFWHK